MFVDKVQEPLESFLHIKESFFRFLNLYVRRRSVCTKGVKDGYIFFGKGEIGIFESTLTDFAVWREKENGSNGLVTFLSIFSF